jgi:hypothetical protein
MKRTIIGWVIYLSGFFTTYQIEKAHCIQDNKRLSKEHPSYFNSHYTVRDKVFSYAISIGSWVSFIPAALFYLSDNVKIDWDKEAR